MVGAEVDVFFEVIASSGFERMVLDVLPRSAFVSEPGVPHPESS